MTYEELTEEILMDLSKAYFKKIKYEYSLNCSAEEVGEKIELALLRQIPKEPIIDFDIICPNCQARLPWQRGEKAPIGDPYCRNCGQAIDWNFEKEDENDGL